MSCRLPTWRRLLYRSLMPAHNLSWFSILLLASALTTLPLPSHTIPHAEPAPLRLSNCTPSCETVLFKVVPCRPDRHLHRHRLQDLTTCQLPLTIRPSSIGSPNLKIVSSRQLSTRSPRPHFTILLATRQASQYFATIGPAVHPRPRPARPGPNIEVLSPLPTAN